jgi:hypothetical protein
VEDDWIVEKITWDGEGRYRVIQTVTVKTNHINISFLFLPYLYHKLASK